LRNYLAKTNEIMHTKIMSFFDKYGNLNPAQFNKIQDYILNIGKWNIDKNIKETGLYYDDSLYTITNFIKNSVYYITKSFPNMILNSVSHNKVHKHWGLADDHLHDISNFIKEYYDKIDKFKNNPVISELLKNIHSWTIDLNLFMNSIPVHTPIYKDGTTFFSLFDKRTLYLLFSYIWYSAFYEFVIATDNKDLINIEIKETKQSQRNKINELRDESNFLQSYSTDKSDDINDEEQLIRVQIVYGSEEKLKEDVCSMLLAFLEIEMKMKNIIDHTYKEISRNVSRTKEQEKKSITDF